MAFEPEHRIAFEGMSGPVRPRGEYRFEVVEAGTRVTFDLTAELSVGKALVVGGAVWKSLEAEVSGLARAKELPRAALSIASARSLTPATHRGTA